MADWLSAKVDLTMMTTKMIMTDAAPSFTHFQTSMTHCGEFACGYHRRLGRDRSGSIVIIVPHSWYGIADDIDDFTHPPQSRFYQIYCISF